MHMNGVVPGRVLSTETRGADHSKNKVGDRTQPWGRPARHTRSLLLVPFSSTQVFGVIRLLLWAWDVKNSSLEPQKASTHLLYRSERKKKLALIRAPLKHSAESSPLEESIFGLLSLSHQVTQWDEKGCDRKMPGR